MKCHGMRLDLAPISECKFVYKSQVVSDVIELGEVDVL